MLKLCISDVEADKKEEPFDGQGQENLHILQRMDLGVMEQLTEDLKQRTNEFIKHVYNSNYQAPT